MEYSVRSNFPRNRSDRIFWTFICSTTIWIWACPLPPRCRTWWWRCTSTAATMRSSSSTSGESTASAASSDPWSDASFSPFSTRDSSSTGSIYSGPASSPPPGLCLSTEEEVRSRRLYISCNKKIQHSFIEILRLQKYKAPQNKYQKAFFRDFKQRVKISTV